ncbi:SAM domain-containing protein SAMSN-1b isoform X2 [Betta splendens]|uniref:SAM domain-containing protein SAMSN-1b isoform X2 n=1 Tax=Betta splendens TaxID=158456 RepID=A0A9W2Y954_BETSP|nr:SAM domain-containing protein SAMSN-1b isoform X2 [Betta splendens]
MNLFCFSLEGSTESIYEPACSQTFTEAVPKSQRSSSLLTPKPEWGSSHASLRSDEPRNETKLKQENKQLCLPNSTLENTTRDRLISHACCVSSANRRDSSCQRNAHNKDTQAFCHNSTVAGGRGKELKCDRTCTDHPAQKTESAADTAESTQTTRRLTKLQSLLQAEAGRGENTYNSTDALSNTNPVLTRVFNLGRTAKKLCENAPSPQKKRPKNHKASEEEESWRPCVPHHLPNMFECPQPWTPLYHTCHQARHELWGCSGALSLPQATQWDDFETLMQQLDSKGCSPAPQMVRSITDLHLCQNTLTRFGRSDAFRHQPLLMKLQDYGKSLQKQGESVDSSQLGLLGMPLLSIRENSEATAEDAPVAVNGKKPINEASKKVKGGRRQSSDSLESLYSLNSGQSSSSGVTSGSDLSSNSNSLRLEDDLFCGRARVHTDHVPSPYDTESLKLQVGDVIDIISKPPMGIWTGMLNGRVGNFKFIYVDMLTEESPEPHSHRARHKSTVQEVLRRLSLEKYASSLQLNGYQTVDDLISLEERHLAKLNMTDPEHRRRLLAAVDCLQQLLSESPSENEVSEETETPGKNHSYPGDSSCHTSSDGPHGSTGHAHLQPPPPAASA